MSQAKKTTKPKKIGKVTGRRSAAKAKPTVSKPATPKAMDPESRQPSRRLDQVSRKFDVAVENLRGNLDGLSEFLYELLATEAKREARRRFVKLAEAGVLHDLQTLEHFHFHYGE